MRKGHSYLKPRAHLVKNVRKQSTTLALISLLLSTSVAGFCKVHRELDQWLNVPVHKRCGARKLPDQVEGCSMSAVRLRDLMAIVPTSQAQSCTILFAIKDVQISYEYCCW